MLNTFFFTFFSKDFIFIKTKYYISVIFIIITIYNIKLLIFIYIFKIYIINVLNTLKSNTSLLSICKI